MHRILYSNIWGGLLVMVSYATFNNISIISCTWQSILWGLALFKIERGNYLSRTCSVMYSHIIHSMTKF
jgi:hypothetical protein